MSDISNAHDKFFRNVWSQTEVAADFLANYLPTRELSRIDLNTLQLENGSFVDESLSEQRSDMLFKAQLTEKAGYAFIYMLFEHKSYVEHHVALQLHRYMGGIWNQYLKASRGEKGANLPLIIPVVFYHGTEAWEPCKLSQLIQSIPEGLGSYVPDFNFVFCNFSAAVTPDIRGCSLLQATLLLLHTVPADELKRELHRIMVLLKGITDDAEGLKIFRAIVEYIYAAQQAVTEDDLRFAARTELSEREEKEAMTVAEKLRKQGIEQGIEQGIREDIKEALTTRFGPVRDADVEKLKTFQDITTLRNLHRLSIQVNSLEEFRERLQAM